MNVWLRTFGCRANQYDTESVRALAEAARAAAHARTRADGEADVVVIGSGSARTGLTGDYLTVVLPDPVPPRGGRFRARLEASGSRPRARPIDTAIS